MTTNKTELKKIDFYGDKDNYIHLKFGDCRKRYNFTTQFQKDYKQFCGEYICYFENTQSQFKNVFQVVNYIIENNLPIALYYNFSDTPVYNKKDVISYSLRENCHIKL